jgi:hypothetical protein
VNFDAGDLMGRLAEHTDVCVVNEQGELKCDPTILATPRYTGARAAIKNALGPVSDPRLDLIMQLIEEVLQAPIDDSCFTIRNSDIEESVHVLVQKPSPVMLLYRYIQLPGNIMATWFIQQNNFDAARDALDDWSKGNLKPGC